MNPRRSPCSSARNARKRIAQAFSLGRSSSRKIFAVQIFFGSPVFLRGRGFKTNRIKTKERKAKTFRSFVVEVTGLEPTTSWSRTKRATKLRYTSFLTYSFEPRSFPRPLGPRRFPRNLSALRFCAPLACTLGRSFSQKSRFAAIFGSPVRARYQTALHLVFNLFFRTAVVSTTSWSSSLPSLLIRVALLRTDQKQHNLLYIIFRKSKTFLGGIL